MTVKDLKEELDNYDDEAEVVVVDFSNGRVWDAIIGSDDEDEFTEFCRISFWWQLSPAPWAESEGGGGV